MGCGQMDEIWGVVRGQGGETWGVVMRQFSEVGCKSFDNINFKICLNFS